MLEPSGGSGVEAQRSLVVTIRGLGHGGSRTV